MAKKPMKKKTKKKSSGKAKKPTGKIKFYDLKGKKSFTTANYDIKYRNVRGNKMMYAVATAPSGIKAWKVIGKA